jgi:hypothetical protein
MCARPTSTDCRVVFNKTLLVHPISALIDRVVVCGSAVLLPDIVGAVSVEFPGYSASSSRYEKDYTKRATPIAVPGNRFGVLTKMPTFPYHNVRIR